MRIIHGEGCTDIFGPVFMIGEVRRESEVCFVQNDATWVYESLRSPSELTLVIAMRDYR